MEHSRGEWRSSDVIGRIYKVNKTDSRFRVFEGDLLLCMKHDGDNHYAYIHLLPRTNNGYNLYFDYGEIVGSYGGHEEAFPKMKTRSAEEILHSFTPGTAFLVSCDEAEDHMCRHCHWRPSGKEKVCDECVRQFEELKNG
jgi:hypothetical protein